MNFCEQISLVLCKSSSCTGHRQDHSVDVAKSAKRKQISGLELSLFGL